MHVLKPQRSPLISLPLPTAKPPFWNATQLPIAVFAAMTKPPVETQIDTARIDDDDDDDFYDAFSDSDFSDTDDVDQVPEDDVKDLVIKFLPLNVWNNSEENEVEYILPPNYGENKICR
jgi:hypothetical protein